VVTKKTWGPHNAPDMRTLREKKRAKATSDQLTDRERILAQSLVGGMTRKAAFQKAGYAAVAAGEDTIDTKPRFVRYVDQLRRKQVERLDYSIDNLCARLERVYLEAMEKSQYGPAVQAVMGIGKMMGHLADKTEIELHILSKPAREPTNEISLSPEEWQRQFTPKQIN
jgi:hypothetical protein